MVLQRYALRFTISDATLDSLKVPRSAANSKKPADEEHKTQAEEIKQNQAEPAETNSATQQNLRSTSDSSSSSPTLSPVTVSNDVPPQSQQTSAETTAEQQQQQQQQLVARDPKPASKHTPQLQPDITQPVHHTLPSPLSGVCRTLPLLAAKPYCLPRASQSGHKPVKVRAQGHFNQTESNTKIYLNYFGIKKLLKEQNHSTAPIKHFTMCSYSRFIPTINRVEKTCFDH